MEARRVALPSSSPAAFLIIVAGTLGLLGEAPAAQAVVCTQDSQCDDGLWCNGSEYCAPGHPAANPLTGCVAGLPTCSASCICDESQDLCTGGTCGGDDADGDGHTPSRAAATTATTKMAPPTRECRSLRDRERPDPRPRHQRRCGIGGCRWWRRWGGGVVLVRARTISASTGNVLVTAGGGGAGAGTGGNGGSGLYGFWDVVGLP